MGTVLKVVGIALLLFVAYVAWVLFRASSTVGVNPKARADVLPDRLRVTVSFPGTDAEFQLTQVFAPRAIGDDLGMASPDGFKLDPYTPADTGDPASDEAAEWAAESNENEIRWTGSLAVKPGSETTIDFPIQKEVGEDFVIRFQYERKIGLGGQISFFTVPVAADAENTV